MILLFDALKRTVKEQISRGVTIDDIDALVIPVDVLPLKYSLRQLNDEVIQSPISSQAEKTVGAAILYRCLQYRERLTFGDDDLEARKKLLTWLIETIQPDGVLFLESQSDNSNSTEVEKAREEWRLTSIFALNSVNLLKLYDLIPESGVNSAVLLGFLGFTQLVDTWNSNPAYEITMEALNRQSHEVLSEAFIIDCVLKEFIRPLFTKSTPRTITSQGRKAPDGKLADQAIKDLSSVDAISKPWKCKDIHAVTVFKWVVTRADEGLISRNWHLFVPPLLTLIDDPTTSVRASGLAILSDFLKTTPPRMLIQTGLGDLLEDALMPTLLFLPGLTPIAESLLLLKEAYAALFVLGDIRDALEDDKPKRNKFYDRLMREGIFPGFNHCRDSIDILELLLRKMGAVIKRLRIYSVKHTKDIMRILSTVLMDPFAPCKPELLLQGIKTLQITILNCWPILSGEQHCAQLVQVLSVCWINVAEEIKKDRVQVVSLRLGQIQLELKISVALLRESTDETVRLTTELGRLINVSPDLSDLFELE